MQIAGLLSFNLVILGIIFSIVIDSIMALGMLNGRISHGNIEKLSMPLAMFLLVLLMYKVVIWTM